MLSFHKTFSYNDCRSSKKYHKSQDKSSLHLRSRRLCSCRLCSRRFFHHTQNNLFANLSHIRKCCIHQIPQYLMSDLIFRKLHGTSRVIHKDSLLRLSHTTVYIFPKGSGVRLRKFLRFFIGIGVWSKGFDVKNLFQIRQDCDKIMSMRIPSWIRHLNIQFSRLGIYVGIVDVTGKGNSRPLIQIIVLFRKSDLKFENPIRKRSPTNKNDTVKLTQVFQGWNQVNSTRSMLFEMLVFNRYLIISESLLTLFL
mmetsp:Transcript_8965/g.12725  ORF Transcript_8965/g.12725 Transcript_8965/m.12725 type:complete len:252 (+) Transcript_8965:858-1613(+)